MSTLKEFRPRSAIWTLLIGLFTPHIMIDGFRKIVGK